MAVLVFKHPGCYTHHHGRKIFASSLLDDAFLRSCRRRTQNVFLEWVFCWSVILTGKSTVCDRFCVWGSSLETVWVRARRGGGFTFPRSLFCRRCWFVYARGKYCWLFYWNNVYVVGLPYKKERGDIVESLGRGGVSCELSIHRLLLRLIVSTGIGKRTKHLHWMTEIYIIIYSAMHGELSLTSWSWEGSSFWAKHGALTRGI